MAEQAERDVVQRLLAGFAFSQDEPAHAKRVLGEYPELIQLLGRLMAAMHQGIGLVEGIPVFAHQDKRTLLVGLVNRSFKCLNVAINCGLRGYYVQAVILVRSVHEDNLLFADLDTTDATVEALYTGNERWFLRGEGRWKQMAERLDQLAAQQGFSGNAAQGWIELYQFESVFAHPRLPALQAEFSRDGTRLKAGVEWDPDGCRRALGGALTAGRLALAMERSLILVTDRTRGWHMVAASIVNDANEWVRAEIQRMKAESLAGPRLPDRDDLIAAAAAFASETPSVRGVLLVGSYARGEHTPRSDVDLLVLTARSTDVSQDAAKEFFHSHLEQRGLHVQAIDVFVLDNQDFGPRSPFRRSAAHMRFLEAERGAPLWGDDFRSQLVPPPRETVLARVLDQVAELRAHPEEIDDRDVLLLATARMYAHTGVWPSKREAADWDQHPAVASAWQQRMSAEQATIPKSEYADYVRLVGDELEAFV